LSIGYISGQATGKRQEAKGGIDNQSLITGFSISISYMLIEKPLPGNTSMFSHSQ
jgi:hypothetical protein